MAPPFVLLVSSAGRRVALMQTFRQALAALHLDGRILAADAAPALSPACRTADQAFAVPPCTSDEFIPAVWELCVREGVRLVVPTIDPELRPYAEHRQSFAAKGTTVAVSDAAVTEIGADKVLTHQWLRANGFPTVEQDSVESVLSRPDGWDFPVLVKPRLGSASIGVAVVAAPAELEPVTRQGDFVVQALARGQEYTIDILADGKGRCVCAVPRRRIEIRSGEVSKGVTERQPDLIELGYAMCAALPGPYGALNIQAFVDPVTNDLRVIELNPRFGGGFPLTWQAGGRFPQWMIEEIIAAPTTASSTAWTDGVLMLRYDASVFVSPGAAPEGR